MNILLVEDNKEIRENISSYLELENHKVTKCANGECGLEHALSYDYDVILLDLMLPKIDGITIAKKLKQKKQTPILMITAKDSIDDKLVGFASGADDYIVKPFDLRELDARIKSIFNRGKKNKENVFIFENIKLDMKKRVFKNNGKNINITSKEYGIIEILLGNRGISISRTQIIEDIWGEEGLFNSDGKLDVYMSNIRTKLNKNMIKTIKGYGYRID